MVKKRKLELPVGPSKNENIFKKLKTQINTSEKKKSEKQKPEDLDIVIDFHDKKVNKNDLLNRKQGILERYRKLTKNPNATLEDLKNEMDEWIHIPGTDIRLRKFDISKINTKKEGQRVGFFGKSGSGKSYICMDVINNNKYIPWIIQSESEPKNHQYGRHFINDLTFFEKFDALGLENGIKRQEEIYKQWKIQPETDPPEFLHDPSLGIVIDDLAKFKKEVNAAEITAYMHCVSRHDKVLFCELWQYYTQLNAEFRRQLSYIIIMEPQSEKDIKSSYSEFITFMSYSDYKKVITYATRNHGALVIDTHASNIEDKLTWYRATFPTPNFQVGTPMQRKIQEILYKNKDLKPEDVKKISLKEEHLSKIDKEQELGDLAIQIEQDEELLKKFEKKQETIRHQSLMKNSNKNRKRISSSFDSENEDSPLKISSKSKKQKLH